MKIQQLITINTCFLILFLLEMGLFGQVISQENIVQKCKGITEIPLNKYKNDLDIYTHILNIYIGPDSIPLEIPKGWVANAEDYNWGFYYRIIVARWERVDIMYIEKIKYFDSEGLVRRINTVYQFNPVEIFLPENERWKPFYIYSIKWENYSKINVTSSEGEYSIDIGQKINLCKKNVRM